MSTITKSSTYKIRSVYIYNKKISTSISASRVRSWRTKKKAQLAMENIWDQALLNLHKTFLEDADPKHILGHMVAFVETLKEAGWTQEELAKASRKKAVMDTLYTNWVGGGTSNKAKRYFQLLERSWNASRAYVWGHFKTAEVNPVKIGKVIDFPGNATVEVESETEVDFDLQELEENRMEIELVDRERLQRLEKLEVSGIIDDEQRIWLKELRERFTK